MNNNAPIGILDSGIGGLTVWREIVRLLPAESTIYYADTANCPYGTKPYPEIIRLAEACVIKLIERGVKIIVIACNTITAASISLLREKYPHMIFVGMEPAVKPAAAITKSGVVGILATKATLAGELYHKTVNSLSNDITILETAGNGLVELIENGKENSEECVTLTSSYIIPMIEQGADCLVLGCTHYPLLRDTINRISGGGLTIINPAPAVARRVKYLLEINDLISKELATNRPDHIFLSSAGEEAAKSMSRKALEILKDDQ